MVERAMYVLFVNASFDINRVVYGVILSYSLGIDTEILI